MSRPGVRSWGHGPTSGTRTHGDISTQHGRRSDTPKRGTRGGNREISTAPAALLPTERPLGPVETRTPPPSTGIATSTQRALFLASLPLPVGRAAPVLTASARCPAAPGRQQGPSAPPPHRPLDSPSRSACLTFLGEESYSAITAPSFAGVCGSPVRHSFHYRYPRCPSYRFRLLPFSPPFHPSFPVLSTNLVNHGRCLPGLRHTSDVKVRPARRDGLLSRSVG